MLEQIHWQAEQLTLHQRVFEDFALQRLDWVEHTRIAHWPVGWRNFDIAEDLERLPQPVPLLHSVERTVEQPTADLIQAAPMVQTVAQLDSGHSDLDSVTLCFSAHQICLVELACCCD